MKYRTYSHRNAEVILQDVNYVDQYAEIHDVLRLIGENEVINRHQSYGNINKGNTPKSLSKALNELIKEAFQELGWEPESGIFQDTKYQGDTWRLDFAKKDISIEVAFNHSSVIAWNLLKPIIASELNHVQKAIQTQFGVIITATQAMKVKGGFDSAIGTFEKYIDYLKPLSNVITTPLLIIGLDAPETFCIEHVQYARRKKIGEVKYYSGLF